MRTAFIAGLITGAATLWLSLSCALSNIDFIYMCASAALVRDGVMPLTSYFPPGYPLMLWAVVQTGIDALTSGMVLSTIGAALSAGSLAYMARRFGLPAVLAALTGLLGATLPDVLQTSFNPHVDALYTGLATALIAAAFRLMDKKPTAAAATFFTICAMLLLTLRYHAVLVVFPVILVVLLNKQAATRRAALIALILSVAALGWVVWGNRVTYGGFESAALKQVATGKVYRDVGDDASQVIFLEYDKWLQTAPPADGETITKAVAEVWPEFLTRRAVVIGFVLLILALIAYRMVPPGSMLLTLFILLYTLAVSPTYFTPRASALPELLAIALAATALGTLYRSPGDLKGKVVPKIDPALSGSLLLVLLVCAIGFNVWRESRMISHWREARSNIMAVDSAALKLAGGNRDAVVGAMDFTGWADGGRFNLPSLSYTRYWLDDPQVAPRIEPYIKRVRQFEIDTYLPPVEVIVLWHTQSRTVERALAETLDTDPRWLEQASPVPGVRLWKRE